MTKWASPTFVLHKLVDSLQFFINGVELASLKRMSTSTVSPEELLERATELAKSDGNLDMIDRITMLHGYLGLRTLDPENGSYRKNVEDAVSSLLQAAHQHAHWHPLVSSQ